MIANAKHNSQIGKWLWLRSRSTCLHLERNLNTCTILYFGTEGRVVKMNVSVRQEQWSFRMWPRIRLRASSVVASPLTAYPFFLLDSTQEHLRKTYRRICVLRAIMCDPPGARRTFCPIRLSFRINFPAIMDESQ